MKTRLHRLADHGQSRVHSVASFFVSRVDTETDRRLGEAGRDDLKGRLGVANAKLAYQQYKAFSRRALGRSRCARSDAAALPLGVDVGKRSESARHALRPRADRVGDDLDHARGDDSRLPGTMADSSRGWGPISTGAQYLFNKLYAAGIDYDDVAATLEREGIEKFVASVDRLLDQIRAKRNVLTAAA